MRLKNDAPHPNCEFFRAVFSTLCWITLLLFSFSFFLLFRHQNDYDLHKMFKNKRHIRVHYSLSLMMNLRNLAFAITKNGTNQVTQHPVIYFEMSFYVVCAMCVIKMKWKMIMVINNENMNIWNESQSHNHICRHNLFLNNVNEEG